jgi:hypothetical protein
MGCRKESGPHGGQSSIRAAGTSRPTSALQRPQPATARPALSWTPWPTLTLGPSSWPTYQQTDEHRYALLDSRCRAAPCRTTPGRRVALEGDRVRPQKAAACLSWSAARNQSAWFERPPVNKGGAPEPAGAFVTGGGVGERGTYARIIGPLRLAKSSQEANAPRRFRFCTHRPTPS